MITIDCGKNNFETKTLLEAGNFFKDKLISDKNLDIFIEICDGITYNEDNSKNQILGYTGAESDTDFYIALVRTDPEEMLITLAHEMVHVKQHAYNEIKKFKKNGIMYCRFHNYDYPVDSIYDEAPWEEEAYIMEKILYKAWNEIK